MAQDARSGIGLGTTIFLLIVVAIAFAVAAVATVAFVQTRQELQRIQAARANTDRWQREIPIARPPATQPGSEVQRLRSENVQLKNEVSQLRAQLRAFEMSRSTVRTVNPGPSRSIFRSSSPFISTDVERPPRNQEEEERFLAENKSKPGVVTLPSGLQYKVIWPGFGRPPREDEWVNLQYRGMLTDGVEIDTSYGRGEAVEFSLSAVMKGWKEALLLMPAGAKWEIYMPSELAYGDRGLSRRIPANATLIYEIELISIRDRNTPVSPAAFGNGVFESTLPLGER